MIFPRKRMKMELFENAPTRTLPLVSESGYMNSELFLNWLQHFVDHVKPSDNDPVLLILDNRASHCSLPAVELCKNHHIVMLSLHPQLQSYDAATKESNFCTFQKYICPRRWLCSHPGRLVGLNADCWIICLPSIKLLPQKRLLIHFLALEFILTTQRLLRRGFFSSQCNPH